MGDVLSLGDAIYKKLLNKTKIDSTMHFLFFSCSIKFFFIKVI